MGVMVDVYIVSDKIYDNLKVYQSMQNVFDDVSNLVLVHFPGEWNNYQPYQT